MPGPRSTFPQWGYLVIAGLCLILLVWLPMRLLRSTSSAVEVARVTSPDRRIDAVLVETNGGATTSFGYRVHLVLKGSAAAGPEAAFLYGATRSDCAYGVNLRWASPNKLVVDYHRARRAEAAGDNVDERLVEVDLAAGVNDPAAPCGGMEYNLRARRVG